MSGTTKSNSEQKSPPVIIVEQEADEKSVDKDKSLHESVRESMKKLTEPLKVAVDKKNMPGLPPIDINELANVLRNPNMPSHKIMKEVADQIVLKCERSRERKDDADVPGMKNLFDCILEVSLLHQDSDNSDDEDEEEHVPIIRQIPCRFCSKVFGSSMTMKTHVLVAHPREDSAVLNVQQVTKNESELGDKSGPSSRRRSKGSKGHDSREKKSRHPSKNDDAKTELVGEENIPIGTRRSSMSRSQVKTSPGVGSEQQDATKSATPTQDTTAKINELETSTDASSITPIRSSSKSEEASQSTTASQKRKSPAGKDVAEEPNLSAAPASDSSQMPDGPSPTKKKRLSHGSTSAAPSEEVVSSSSRKSRSSEKRRESEEKPVSEGKGKKSEQSPQEERTRPRRSSRRL